MSDAPRTIMYLKDYTPPPYLVTTIDLHFELDETATLVGTKMRIIRNPASAGEKVPLELNGEKLEIRSVRLDGVPIDPSGYAFDGATLKIADVPDSFDLDLETIINPRENTELEGLYLSKGNFCTQCEAEGFRRITCFPDRPDVMTEFTTTIVADPGKYPVRLSNGNLLEQGHLADGRHYAVWHDPFRKPCYLFALVAGNLVRVKDRFITMSGREVDLHIYVEPRNSEKCGHAMESLKKAMRWDEETFGLEYDLDVYMIVAVDDFNMGAMENKGLNVFNSKFVLARPETATDTDYAGIQGVIGHEYFHNWTGNRVTCRDWFQLSLKEGLTVFRDQEFTADMTSRPVKRIHDVQLMRNFQFREDAGPMAHPVRPESYMAINNFYTLTVYDKGAEVIRMLHTFLGREGFRRGLELYCKRHDGQAVTCDDFVAAMVDANDADIDGFKLWYSQAGTPVLRVKGEYDPDRGEYRLTVHQSTPPTPSQKRKAPLLMPLAVGLLDSSGRDMDPGQGGPSTGLGKTRILTFGKSEQTWVFTDIPERPVLSFLRNFSAPVKVEMDRSDEELAFLMAHDPDPCNRWDASQQLGLKCILAQIESGRRQDRMQVPEGYISACKLILLDTEADPAFIALALTLPMESWIGEQMAVIDPDGIFQVLQFFRGRLGSRLQNEFMEVYERNLLSGEYRFNAEEAGRRSLKNTCLEYLLAPDQDGRVAPDMLSVALTQYETGNNMTDKMAALKAVVNGDLRRGEELLADFYAAWKDEPLVVDKWLTLQALCPLPGALERVRKLMAHPAFTLKNPNKVRALIGAFCASNQVRFHDLSGEGYAFLGDCVVEIDTMNPQIAARLLTPVTVWKRYDLHRQSLMRAQLERIMASPALSREVAEVAGKCLQ